MYSQSRSLGNYTFCQIREKAVHHLVAEPKIFHIKENPHGIVNNKKIGKNNRTEDMS